MSDAAAVHREMFEAVQMKDLERMREIYHPDYAYTGTDGMTAGIDAGIEIAQAFITAMPDLEFEFRHQWSPRDDVSIIELTATGTHTGPLGELAPTGRRVEIVGCNVVEVVDGKILREREYFDEMALMRQLGAIAE
jgi:predicted ester cyclase